MAFQPSVRTKTSLAETQYQAAIADANMGEIASTINWIIDNISNLPVGAMSESMLTEAQFQAIRGVNWVLADGRNVAGSAFQTLTGNANIPDMRMTVSRGKNNGRADAKENLNGDLNLGTVSAGQIKSHNHVATQTYDSRYVPPHTNNSFDTEEGAVYTSNTTDFGTISGAISSTGISAQSLVRCVTVNVFIRID